MPPQGSVNSNLWCTPKKPHIVALQETWLHNNSKAINILGYKLIRKDRTDRGGGGLLFAVREDIQYKIFPLTEQPNNTIECQAIEISVAHDKIRILNIYNRVICKRMDQMVVWRILLFWKVFQTFYWCWKLHTIMY